MLVVKVYKTERMDGISNAEHQYLTTMQGCVGFPEHFGVLGAYGHHLCLLRYYGPDLGRLFRLQDQKFEMTVICLIMEQGVSLPELKAEQPLTLHSQSSSA